MNKTCRIGWTSTAPITQVCALVWRSSMDITTVCRTGWAQTVPVDKVCALGWRNTESINRTCTLGWRHWDGQTVDKTCALGWQEIETEPEPPPSPSADPADDVLVIVDGQVVDPVRITINQSRQQAAIDAEIELATEEEWQICRRFASATIQLWGQQFALVVDSRDRAESFGATTWTARLASPVIELDMAAEPVTGELSGLASEIAVQLAAPLRHVRWQVVDWHIGPGRWIANGETPLALLQTLVTVCGAALLSTPDGGLEVVPQYPVSVPAWPTATPDFVLNRNVHLISIQTSAEQGEGINVVTVRDQEIATDNLRIVEDTEKRRNNSTEVLVYQTPWNGRFHLTHRGDSGQVLITNLQQEERIIEDEEIIITDGSGHTSLPVYAILSARYNARNLGTPTYSEDGTITTAVQDESILLLTYRTRARRYRVLSKNKADVLIVAETID